MYTQNNKRTRTVGIKEMCVFAMLGTLMFTSKMLMEALPNIHLVGMITVACTLVFRVKALIPVYVYVFLTGFYMGFSAWWVPNLYVWTVLWGMAMLVPRGMQAKTARIVYPCVCALHGLTFGVLYAPAQAILFGLDLKQMLAWIAAGFPWDCVHAVGNFTVGLLIFPLSRLLDRLKKIHLPD